MLKELVTKCRSFRRFDGSAEIAKEDLLELVDLARMTASTANSQALKFFISNEKEMNDKLFETIGWAGALPDWDGPIEEERPTAYIVILCDKKLGTNKLYDDGITAQTIMLGAVEKGLGGCMIANCNRVKISEILGINNDDYSVDLVLAIGKPVETVKVVPMPENGDVRYYRDENQVHYVPKRSLDEVLFKLN